MQWLTAQPAIEQQQQQQQEAVNARPQCSG
jgi:hypothetical protein